jgi:hypothetical protein
MNRPISIAEAVARAAESKIGIREEGGPNKGKGLAPFFAADWYKPNGPKGLDDGYPWCAAFVCWCVQVAIAGRTVTFERPRTPSAYGLEEWSLAQDDSTWTLRDPGPQDLRRGDIVTLKRVSHVGIAVSAPDEAGFVTTVEGNTNEAGSREGDGVYQKRRHYSEIRARIRFRDK